MHRHTIREMEKAAVQGKALRQTGLQKEKGFFLMAAHSQELIHLMPVMQKSDAVTRLARSRGMRQSECETEVTDHGIPGL